jgi:ABC-2 type transport system ATP-binding protein
VTADHAIAVRLLTRRFGRFTAFYRFCFDVGRGDIFGFLGATGAAKSTTIRMLCGLLKPTAGSATVDGIDVSRDPEAVKQRIGYMSQKFSLYEALTVEQNISFFGALYGLDDEQIARRRTFVIDMAGLAGREATKARELAGGWRQRLALGCAILHEPRIVFLDEPTGGVDPVSRRQFWRLIEDLSRSGVTILVTTHYLDEAEHCHRIAIINAGKVAAIGTSRELKHIFADRPIVEIHSSRPVAVMKVLDGMAQVQKTSVFGTAVHAVLTPGTVDLGALGSRLRSEGLVITSIDQVMPSLEDVFLDVVERAS